MCMNSIGNCRRCNINVSKVYVLIITVKEHLFSEIAVSCDVVDIAVFKLAEDRNWPILRKSAI